jgi:hypothetical protein
VSGRKELRRRTAGRPIRARRRVRCYHPGERTPRAEIVKRALEEVRPIARDSLYEKTRRCFGWQGPEGVSPRPLAGRNAIRDLFLTAAFVQAKPVDTTTGCGPISTARSISKNGPSTRFHFLALRFLALRFRLADLLFFYSFCSYPLPHARCACVISRILVEFALMKSTTVWRYPRLSTQYSFSIRLSAMPTEVRSPRLGEDLDVAQRHGPAEGEHDHRRDENGHGVLERPPS